MTPLALGTAECGGTLVVHETGHRSCTRQGACPGADTRHRIAARCGGCEACGRASGPAGPELRARPLRAGSGRA